MANKVTRLTWIEGRLKRPWLILNNLRRNSGYVEINPRGNDE